MKINLISVSLIVCCSLVFSPLFADDIADLKRQLQAMQEQMKLMQAKLEAQEELIKNQSVASQTVVKEKPSESAKKSVIHEVADSISIGGVVEVVASHSNNESWTNQSTSDIALDTFELGVSASAGDWVTGNILFLYEDADDDNFMVDEAYVGFSNPDVTPVFANIGRLYVPFGNFSSNMISDPATLTLGETRADVIQLGVNMDSGLYSSAYVFNGDAEKIGKNNNISNFGANIGFTVENDNMELDAGIGYINNIATTDGLVDLVGDNPQGATMDYVGGLSFHVVASFAQINLIAEYVTAMDSFNSNELTSVNNDRLKPKAWNLEAAYSFDLAGRDSTIALGYQKTKDMFFDTESTDLFEKAWLASISMAIFDNTTLIAEWRRASAYSEIDTALGYSTDEEDKLQLKLSYEF